jgi:hypothetical protein
MEPRWSYPIPMAMQPTSTTGKAGAERLAPAGPDKGVAGQAAGKTSRGGSENADGRREMAGVTH